MVFHANMNPAARGYRILYRAGVTNYCPGCGHANWYVGRAVAECAFCTTVLPLSDNQTNSRDFALAG